MKIRDVLLFSFQAILRGKSRVLLTLLAISIGVCSVFLISTLSENGTNAVDRELDKIGFECISVFGSDENSKLFQEDVEMLEKAKGIEAASPMVIVYGGCRLKKEYSQVLFWGIDSNVKSVLNLTILHGRLPSAADIRSNRPCAVVDSTFAEKHYKRENIVGKKLVAQIGSVNHEFEIIGVVAPQKDVLNQMVGGAIPEFIYVPYTTLNQMRGKNDITQIALKSSDSVNTETIKENLSDHRQRSYEVENFGGYVDGFRSVAELIGLIISAIAAISLCIAGIGIMNSMLSSVHERKKEIGICMAIGATRNDIVRCFLTEGILTTLLGSILGFLLAFGIISVLGSIFQITIAINCGLVFFIGLSAVLLGALFSIAPAIQASKLDPIQTLRSEI